MACLVLVTFFVTSLPLSYAQNMAFMHAPGSMVSLSGNFAAPSLKGIKVYPENPFRFDFLLDQGSSGEPSEHLKAESARLVRYFLTTLTIPEKDLWVNLSPYEKDRMVPDAFGQTEMGRDMLAQDYILKQVTASLLYPEGETGRAFWARVYAAASEKYGTTDIPVDTFNKVWIMPDKAVVDEYNGMAFVVEGKLKVMLESDYLASGHMVEASTDRLLHSPSWGGNGRGEDVVKKILREIIIPILEKEVNEGRSFAPLRQVYHSLILAAWYKRKIKESLLGKFYVDQRKIAGVDVADKTEKEQIYARYLEAFKKGVYNFIKEEYDPAAQEMIPRKYFSGGEEFTDRAMAPALQVKEVDAAGLAADVGPVDLRTVVVDIRPVAGSRAANDPLSPDHGMAAPLLAGELSDVELERLWTAYVGKEGLSRYEKLLKLFTRDVKEALLDDPALRPVFLQALPAGSLGELVVAPGREQALARKIGAATLRELMEQHSGFLITDDLKKANELAAVEDLVLLVGVTDRYSDDTMYPLHQVANGRQAYFPLSDGSWLGVKGAGQFIDRHKMPHFLHENEKIPRNTRYMGVATETDAKRAERGSAALKGNAGDFVEFLGYRRLYDLPDGDGHLATVKGLKDRDGSDLVPVLIFNRTLYPQRLVKLPQLVKTDYGLRRLSLKLSGTLSGLGLLPANTELSGSELILMILKKRGRAEAIKQNSGVFKITIHSQDITLAGEEADNEELVPYAEYIKLVEQGIAMQTDDRDLLLTNGSSTAGIRNTVVILLNMMFKLPEDQKRILLPSPSMALQTLFEAYFSLLDDRHLKL